MTDCVSELVPIGERSDASSFRLPSVADVIIFAPFITNTLFGVDVVARRCYLYSARPSLMFLLFQLEASPLNRSMLPSMNAEVRDPGSRLEGSTI